MQELLLHTEPQYCQKAYSTAQLCSNTEGMTASKVRTGSLPLPNSTIWKLPRMLPVMHFNKCEAINQDMCHEGTIAKWKCLAVTRT